MQEEDIRIIDDLTLEILEKAKELTTKALDKKTKKGFLNELHIGEQDLSERPKGEAYYFFSENEMDVALYLFFSNKYNAKRIARSCYLLDEDDKFIESMGTDIMLGKVKLPNGSLITTGTVEVLFKVREYGTRNKKTGMPFDIMAFRLIYEE